VLKPATVAPSRVMLNAFWISEIATPKPNGSSARDQPTSARSVVRARKDRDREKEGRRDARIDAWTESLFAVGAHGSRAVNASDISPMLIALIGDIGAGDLNGTWSRRLCKPCESHATLLLSGSSADWPVAITSDVAPLRYAVKSWETCARFAAPCCGRRRPASVMLFDPGDCAGGRQRSVPWSVRLTDDGRVGRGAGSKEHAVI
jgi:hypothetical protein